MSKGTANDPAQCDLFSFTPAMTPHGDGSYTVRPGKPVVKMTVQQAAGISKLSKATIYRLYHGDFIAGERLSPRRIVIHSESLQEHLKKCQDPEFWEDAERKKRYSATFRLHKDHEPQER